MASIIATQMKAEAKRLNTMNMKIKSALESEFELPVYMNVVSENEMPENLTYFIIETDDYLQSQPSKSVRENVTITMWSKERPDPVLDHLMVIAIGLENRLDLESATNDYIIMEKTNEIINMFTCNFKRKVKVGC